MSQRSRIVATGLAWAMSLALGFGVVGEVVGAEPFSWQKPHAKVLPTGDLEWAPEPFVYEAGASVRYIDFESGSDANDGRSPDSPWKHHPWDPAATGKAKADSGADTFVFKGGVIYRGQIVVPASGAQGKPIRITRDPSWGDGPAMWFGSQRITGGWKRANAQTAPGIPEPTRVWYLDELIDWTPHAMWELRGGDVHRIHIARDPNWTLANPDDPQQQWYEWKNWQRGKPAADPDNLAGKPADFFEGGQVWTEWTGNMGTIHIADIKSYDPQTGAIGGHNGRKGNRYYIENVRGYLDSPGEFYFDTEAKRLFVRMPEDRDPNRSVIELAKTTRLIDIVDKSYIRIRGLAFRFTDAGDLMSGWPPVAAERTTIRIAGNCSDITVSNCSFRHVASVLNVHPRMNRKYSEIYLKDMLPWREDVIDRIEFSDNDLAYVDRPAVLFAEGRMLQRVEHPPYGKLRRIKVLRNRLYHIGSRPGSNIYTAIPSIGVYFPEQAEIAGNIVDQVWGSGIFVFGGRASGEIGSTPLTRILIHHNKITNAMLACNDYGGLEYWQGGPYYVYSNISGNSIGYKHYMDLKNDWKTVAYNVYLDGTFKSYTFNNIIWGKSGDVNYPYRNRGAYFVVLGFMNHFFNNTAYNFRRGIVGSSGNRSSYLGNLVTEISGSFIQQNRKGDTSLRGGGDTGAMGLRGMPTNAYGYNVFIGDEPIGNAGGVRGNTLAEWQKGLSDLGARCSQVGFRGTEMPLSDPADHDFSLKGGTLAVDKGVRFFVPWALYATVGEWNFQPNPANHELILGEHFYMNREYMERHQYDLVPRNDLVVKGASGDDFVDGPLENWTRGALAFDGKRTAVLAHRIVDQPYEVNYVVRGDEMAKGKTVIPADQRETVDMDANSFLIEVCFRTVPGKSVGAVLAEKMSGDTGYRLSIGRSGAPVLTLSKGGTVDTTQADAVVNDGNWHHVIAEVDRAGRRATIYVDGRDGQVGASPRQIALPADLSLSNAGDFVVGRGLVGAVDFVRVCRGTLADADTTIEELYAWQFAGPQHRDFAGRQAKGERRDAGAMEAMD